MEYRRFKNLCYFFKKRNHFRAMYIKTTVTQLRILTFTEVNVIEKVCYKVAVHNTHINQSATNE